MTGLIAANEGPDNLPVLSSWCPSLAPHYTTETATALEMVKANKKVSRNQIVMERHACLLSERLNIVTISNRYSALNIGRIHCRRGRSLANTSQMSVGSGVVMSVKCSL